MRTSMIVALLVLSSYLLQVVVGAGCSLPLTDGSNKKITFDGSSIAGTENAYNFYLNPCGPAAFQPSSAPCATSSNTNSAQTGNMYQVSSAGTSCSTIATTLQSFTQTNANGGTLVLKYVNDQCCKCQGGATARQATITLACGKTASFTVTEPGVCNYDAVGTHPAACTSSSSGNTNTNTNTNGNSNGSNTSGGKHDKDKGGLSPGSIFLIVFFATAVVYVVAGFIVNWKVRGANPGVDAVPNVELWASIPGLVVDGLVFTKNKVLGLFGRGYNQL